MEVEAHIELEAKKMRWKRRYSLGRSCQGYE
jgi:hypothetical protein